MLWRGSKNRYQIGMCLGEIGLRAQNMLVIPGLVVSVIWQLKKHGDLHLDNG